MKYDVHVLVNYDRTRGLWAAETSYTDDKHRERRLRQGGSLPTTASNATLTASAIIAGSRVISNRVRDAITARTGIPRVRIKIVVPDESFALALVRATAESHLRAGRQFKDQLSKTLSRFEWTVRAATDKDMPLVLGIRAWAHALLANGRMRTDAIDRLFSPSVVHEPITADAE